MFSFIIDSVSFGELLCPLGASLRVKEYDWTRCFEVECHWCPFQTFCLMRSKAVLEFCFESLIRGTDLLIRYLWWVRLLGTWWRGFQVVFCHALSHQVPSVQLPVLPRRPASLGLPLVRSQKYSPVPQTDCGRSHLLPPSI